MALSPSLTGANASVWGDMSNHVVHFTKPGVSTPYDAMMGILSIGRIEARNPFGIAKSSSSAPPGSQHVSCFSETPLHELSRLVHARSEYGIGFTKDFVVANGANPILYAYKDQGAANAIRLLMAGAGNDANNPIWRLTPFVDVPGTYGSASYFFEWEREWRKVGDLTFAPDDVAFLIIPEGLHEAAVSFFHTAYTDNLGPSYTCPMIDGLWSQAQVANALSGSQ